MRNKIPTPQKTKQHLFFFAVLIACTLSLCCHPPHEDQQFYTNLSIEETLNHANNAKSNFCIVLLDSTQDLSIQYKQYLTKSIQSKNGIYNIVDVNLPQNEWLVKCLCPLFLPLTCVFSSDGTLIDLIPGATMESSLYTKEALLNGQTTKFHYVNRFNRAKEHIIPLYNEILSCNLNLRQGFFTELNNPLIDSLKYPYPHYLQILGNILNNDTINAQKSAKKLINIESPYFLSLFRNEFIMAKKIINPKFDISNEPNIRVCKDTIIIQNHKAGESVPFDIFIFNDGESPLNISNIFMSCTCLNFDKLENTNIPPKDSIKVHFTFKAEEHGFFSRDIFITSNAINKPILYLQILADITD